MNIEILACISQFIFYFYWLTTEWVDFFPWNDIRSAKREDQIKGTIFHSSMMIICFASFLSGIKWLMGIAVIWFTVLLTIEILNWVVPYLFGVHPAEIDKEIYAEHFSKTYRFLPPIKDHNIIDAQHVVVIVLTTMMWSTSVWTLIGKLFR
jgi:hypothetical protein